MTVAGRCGKFCCGLAADQGIISLVIMVTLMLLPESVTSPRGLWNEALPAVIHALHGRAVG